LYATVNGFYPHTRPFENLPASRRTLGKLTLLVLFLSLPQVTLGAFLRGELHDLEKANSEWSGSELIENAGSIDLMHRSYTWIILAGVAFLIYYVHRRTDQHRWLIFNVRAIGVLLAIQIGAGIVMAYAGLPPAFQAIHLVNGSLFLGSLTILYLLASRVPVGDSPSESVSTLPAVTSPLSLPPTPLS
jgi:cytochrome c oxidase assembly protein subunit 15